MPEQERDIIVSLGHLGDVLRIRFVKDRGKVIRFTVQYEALVDEVGVPIVRYDTAHGAAHRDMLDWDGTTRHTDSMSGHTNYAEAMDSAIADIESNWERYRFEFFRRRP